MSHPRAVLLTVAVASVAIVPAATADVVLDPDVLSPTPDGAVAGLATSQTFTFSAAAPTECSLDDAAFAPCASPVALTGLADGRHAFTIRETGPGPSVTRHWIVDTTGPAGQAVLEPTQGDTVPTARVQLRWSPAQDTGSAVERYEVVLDGGAATTVAPSPQPMSITADRLSDGPHTWSVVAVDALGNRSAPVTGRFVVAVRPTARLVLTQSLGLSTLPIALDSASDDNGTGPLTHDWDLDGDGTFETSTGGTGSIARAFAPGARTVALRVTDAGGLSDTTQVQLTILPGPPAGRVGIAIGGGTRFVRSRDVDLRLVWPAYARGARISTDGEFRPGRTIALKPSVRWTLPDGLDGVRTVYVRYPRPGAPLRTYRDEVVLDRSIPEIERIATASGWAVRATDETSGVQELQVVTNGVRSDWLVFGSRAAAVALGRADRARVRDRAGNPSRWLALP